MTYAQRDEERYIEKLGDSGRYLEIGSYDGKTFSNTRALAERGWEGVCVEPAAHAFAAMLRDPPPHAKLIHALLGPRTGLASFLQTQDAVSTTDRNHAEKWKGYAVPFTLTFTVSVSVIDLLKDFPGPYRFISIDTEGTSMWAFREFAPLLEHLEVEMICVEHDGAKPHAPGFHEIYRSAENSILAR